MNLTMWQWSALHDGEAYLIYTVVISVLWCYDEGMLQYNSWVHSETQQNLSCGVLK